MSTITPIRERTRASRPWSLIALLLSLACTGEIGGGGRASGSGGSLSGAGGGATGSTAAGSGGQTGPGADPQTEPTPEQCQTATPFVGPSLMRRLTRLEYDLTVRDLLGDERQLSAGFTPENRNNGFDNQAASQNVQRDDITLWEAAAQKLARAAVEKASTLLGCDVAAASADTCLQAALPELASRLFRRPVDDDQRLRYGEHYDARRAAGASSARAAELAITAMLMSPHFLYLVEPALDGQQRPLDSFEAAARLSYLLTKSAPDAELWAAAEGGGLSTAEGIRAQAERLGASATAARAVEDFYFQWADGPGIDALVIPEGFDDSLRVDAQNEVTSLVRDWFAVPGALIPQLFTMSAATVSEPLARYYGLPSGSSGLVGLPATERSGLLTRAVFVGTHPLPPTRGDFVLNRVLCSPVPPPPVVPPDPMELGQFNTRREMFEAHAQLACAKGCHAVLDPVGFPFEHYDEAGRYRTEDNGFPIDAATTLSIPGADDLNGPVSNALELSQKIAGSTALLACQAEQWFRYAYARLPAPIDRCSVSALSANLQTSQGEVRALLAALTQTDAFRYVRKEAP